MKVRLQMSISFNSLGRVKQEYPKFCQLDFKIVFFLSPLKIGIGSVVLWFAEYCIIILLFLSALKLSTAGLNLEETSDCFSLCWL